jgi:outer membrane protein assembly factor BamB
MAAPIAGRFRGGRFASFRAARIVAFGAFRSARRASLMRRAGVAVAAMLLTSVLTPVTAALTQGPAVAASYQDWPMFLQNAQRTAATADPRLSVASAPTLKLKFAFATGGPIATSASIVGTTAYVGSWDGYEYAVDTQTGTMIWKQYLGVTTDPGCNPVNNGITSSAAIVNGVLYVGGGGPYWYALDPATGNVLWKVYTGDNSQAGAHYNWSSPLIVGSYAYIGIASNCDNPLVQGQLLEVGISGAQQGQIVNTYNFVPNGQVGGGIWTTPTYDPATNTIFVSTGTLNDHTQTQSQAIVALNATSLQYESSWQLPFEASVLDSDWGTTPTLTTDAAGDQLLSVANKNGILYTFNRNDLAAGPVWQHQIAIGGDCPTCGDGTIASGIFANGTLYYAGGNNIQGSHGSGGSITAFDPGTGRVLWSRQTEQPILGSPAYVNGMIGETEGNTFEVLDASSGALLYSYVLPATVYGAVSVARSQFYVGAVDGKLYAFGLPGSTAAPPADPNCPSSFTCQDIRNPGVAGAEQSGGGTLTVTASGAEIHGTSDQFRFISKPVTGDSQSSVEILSQSTQNTQPQAGLMARQSTDPTSPFYAVLAYPNDLTEGNPQADIVIWYRSAFGGTALELTKLYPANKPIYLMIQRQGSQFSTGYSTDGTNYQLIPGTTADIDMPATTLQGLAVDSGSSSNTGTASFSNLAVGGAVTTTMTPQAPADPCPASWTCTDVGNPNPPGDTTSTGPGAFTLDGTGTGITTAGTDSFHYAYQQASGNETLSAQVVTQAGSPKTAQEGIMMRANTSPTSPYYSVLLNPGGSATIQWRAYDGVPDRTGSLKLPSVTSPAYVEVVRWQDTTLNPPQTFFSTLTSADGSTWTPVLGSTVAIDMPVTYLAGLAATANAPRVAPPVSYNAVTVTASATEPPGICPSGFSCSDVGTDILPGNQVYIGPQQGGGTAGTWTVQAGGSDIWSNYDSFRFIYQDFPQDTANSANGDGTVSARVVSQANPGGPWMKSGVMIRSGSGTDPQAPYYGVFVTPQHGVTVQWRTAQAAQSNQVLTSSSVTTPVWVMASRYTDTAHGVVYYTAYTSTDGVTFTAVPGSTVSLNLPGPLVAGIASDSYNSTLKSTATIDNYAQLSGSQPPPGICPAAWTCSDIGGALPPGQDELSSGTWNEVGGGGDIWGSADAFHFAAQPLAADGTVTAHVTAQQNTDPWAKAGVMMRASTDPGSPYYAAFVTPGNGIAVQWRTAQGGSTSQQLAAGGVPAYLMIGRYTTGGSTYYTAYTSPDGSTWTAIPGSTVAIAMTGTLQAGIAITSHNQGTGSAVTLDGVAVAAGEQVPPGICPGAWSCADIGTVTPSAGSQTYAAGGWTIQGGGGDIWSASDSFHYVWQSLAADGSLTAHVDSQTNSDPWAKAGLMIRASSDPGAPYYAVYVTAGNGIVVQSRDTAGNNAVQEAATSGGPPVFLEIIRSGTTFTAATSADGTTWTPIPGSAATLPNLAGQVLAGMAVTSHNTGQLSTAVFDTVAVTP